MDQEIERQEDVTVFWDFSCTQNSSAAATIPTSALVKNICTAVNPYGPLKSIRLYWDHAGYPIQPAATRIRSELSASGVCLIDCPAEGRKEGAMKKMLVDLIIHAWDHEADPNTYVVIATDRDIAYALSRLRMKEYRIILLSPALTHSDLTSQATIQLDWTKSILGLTSLPHTNLEDIPVTTKPSSYAREASSSRLRGGSLSGVYQESGSPPLPNTDTSSPGHRSSSPFLPNTTIGNGLAPGALPQSPPRASTWSTPGDFHVASASAGVSKPKPISSNSMPSGRTAVSFNGTSGVSFENISRDNPLSTETTFDPFNDPDEWPRPSFSGSGDSKTRMESVTPSSESTGSLESGFSGSLPNPQAASTAPTSVKEERKPANSKPQSSAENTVDLGKTGRNTEIPRAGEGKEACQSESRPTQTARLPSPLVHISLPTTTTSAPTVTATSLPSAPFPTPKPSVNATAVAPVIAQMWDPLISTLRENGGKFSYTALPPKLLKLYPRAYVIAGRSKYKQYIQLAVESGIVVEQIEDDPACPSIHLAAAYL